MLLIIIIIIVNSLLNININKYIIFEETLNNNISKLTKCLLRSKGARED